MSLKVALLIALLASGCNILAPSGPSEVARGEYYAAGKPEFDSFFIALHDKQVLLLEAPHEPRDARQNLTQLLGLLAEASDDSVRERLGQEVQKLSAKGLRLRLDVPNAGPSLDASATLFASDTNTATPLRIGLPQIATRLVRSRNRMLANKAELEQLTVTGITLEANVDQAFRIEGPWKRDEVRKNLADGQKLVTLMQARGQELIDFDAKLLSLLADVVNTDASLGKAPTPSPPPPEAAPKAKHTAAKPGPPRGVASKPGAQRPPAAKRGPAGRTSDDDAAPAPKPTQGNAPAEIEP